MSNKVEILNIAYDPTGPMKDVLKPMILYCISKNKIITDKNILKSLNEFMEIKMSGLISLLTELIAEKKIVNYPFRYPLKVNGNYARISMYSLNTIILE